METLAALVPQMMPYYEDKSPRPTFPLRVNSNEREVTPVPSTNEREVKPVPSSNEREVK
jgi:hypothetical protein